MTATAPGPITCSACSTPGRGRFCIACGASLSAAHCAACGMALVPGARFCSGCGASPSAPVARAADPGERVVAWMPWAMTGVVIVLAAFVIGQRVGSGSASAATAQGSQPATRTASGTGAVMSAPDISRLSPRERVDRLYDRIMRLDGEGKRDSVGFFANMAIPAYATLPTLDDDLRYDLGRIEEAAGAFVLARAQADTILRANPTHLLGLTLGMRTAAALGDSAGARSFGARLVAAARAERGKALPEYARHAADIADALKEAGQK